METSTNEPPRIFDECVAGLAVTVSSAGLSVALAALIFSGPLAVGLPRAAANFLVAAGVLTMVVGIVSGIRPSLAILQDGPAIVFVTIAGSVSATVSGDPVANVLVLLALIGVITGVVMVVVGQLGAGRIVRFFPTTVIGGFIAGTGWLLFKGGFDIMLDRTLDLDDLELLLESAQLALWLPGLALGVLLVVLGRSERVPSILVGLSALAATALFFVVVLGTSSLDQAEANGWLIGPFPDGSAVSLVTPTELAEADWGHLLQRPGAILAMVAVSIVALLLNLSSLESLTRDRVDLQHELRATGALNVLLAPFGSVGGFHALGDTVLARQMGARTRAVPVAVGLVSIAAGVFGTELIGLTPRIIAGGLLIAVGVGLLVSWLESLKASSSRAERALSISIVVLIAAVGILEGITFGLIAACLIFVVRYSSIDPIKQSATIRELPSRVVRSATEADRLAAMSDRVVVFQLTGFQFFGSFATVIERISAAVSSTTHSVVIDFRHVTGIDSSGFRLLDDLIDDLLDQGVAVLLSDVTPAVARRTDTERVRVFAGLDFAIEHAEEALLGQDDASVTSATSNPFEDLSPALRSAFTSRHYAEGDVVIEQGTPGDSLFLVISGSLAVIRLSEDGSAHRLRRIGSGTVVGERSMLLHEPRSARISADTESELLEISAADFADLQQASPTVALELQSLLLNELIRRSESLSAHLSLALR